MAQLFIIMAIGYALFKLKYLDSQMITRLTKLLLDITLPLLIISSVMDKTEEVNAGKIGMVFLISFCLYVFLSVLSIIVIKIMHFPKPQQGLYIFMHTFANIGFMGFPIINALYGNEAMLYTAILNIFFNLFAYTVGIMMVNYSGSLKNEGSSAASLINAKSLISVGTIGSLLAIVIYFLPVTFPDVVTGVCSTVGGLTSPLAMILIGATLAKMPLKKVFNDWRVYLFAFVKQFVMPFPIYFLMRLVVADELVRNVLFILCIMPVANTSVLFANRYKKDEELAAKNVFVTTLVSIVSIPVILSVLNVGA